MRASSLITAASGLIVVMRTRALPSFGMELPLREKVTPGITKQCKDPLMLNMALGSYRIYAAYLSPTEFEQVTIYEAGEQP